MPVRCLRTDYGIADVYSYQIEFTRPLIHLKKLELPTILHIRNFWVRHLLSPNVATYCTSYAKLTVDQRPKVWSTIKENVELGANWVGYWCKSLCLTGLTQVKRYPKQLNLP